MYEPVTEYLRPGDVIYEVPIPFGNEDGFAVKIGPAMLVDGACMICKPDPNAPLNLAPLWTLDSFDRSTQGLVRSPRRDVRRLFYLPAGGPFDVDYVADLQWLSPRPRSAFPLELVHDGGDPNEPRWRVNPDEEFRATSLDDDARNRLKIKLVYFFELEKTRFPEQGTLPLASGDGS